MKNAFNSHIQFYIIILRRDWLHITLNLYESSLYSLINNKLCLFRFERHWNNSKQNNVFFFLFTHDVVVFRVSRFFDYLSSLYRFNTHFYSLKVLVTRTCFLYSFFFNDKNFSILKKTAIFAPFKYLKNADSTVITIFIG